MLQFGARHITWGFADMPIKKKSLVSAMTAPAVNQPKPIANQAPPTGMKHESMKKGLSIFKS
jgi:hypothetical protein